MPSRNIRCKRYETGGNKKPEHGKRYAFTHAMTHGVFRI